MVDDLATMQRSALDRMVTGQAQSISQAEEQQKTYKQKLAEKQAMAQLASGKFQERAGAAMDPSNPYPVSPAQVFGAFNSLQNSIMDKVAPAQTGYDDATKSLMALRADPTVFNAISSMIQGGVSSTGEDTVADAYIEQITNGSIKKPSEIPAADRSRVLQRMKQLGVSFTDAVAEAEGSGVTNLINEMKNLYYGNPDITSDDLSRGRFIGTGTKIKAAIGLNDTAKTYRDAREGMLASLKAITGDTGILTDQDAERLKGMIPDVTDTKGEAEKKWNFILKAIQYKYANPNKPIPIDEKAMGGVNTNVTTENSTMYDDILDQLGY